MILDTEANLKSKVISAIKDLFVADSLSMPVHWFYRVSDIYSLFPNGIANLEDAPPYHPGSIMSLHSTWGGGRKKNEYASGVAFMVIFPIYLEEKNKGFTR